MYTSVRELLFKHAFYISSDFMSLDEKDDIYFLLIMLCFLKCARTCYHILDGRKILVLHNIIISFISHNFYHHGSHYIVLSLL